MIVLVLPAEIHSDEILERARKGDKTAIASIYNQYFEPIYQFVRFRVASQQHAEDITSDIFLALIHAFKRNKAPNTNLRAWLFRVARNKIADHHASRDTLPLETIEQWLPDDALNVEAQILQAFSQEQVRQWVMQLSLDQQTVLLLRFSQQLSLQETADIVGKKVNTVKTIQSRALKKLGKLAERALEME
jgi:RNA polymerase sigma-70 factor (ECF subfamily)